VQHAGQRPRGEAAAAEADQEQSVAGPVERDLFEAVGVDRIKTSRETTVLHQIDYPRSVALVLVILNIFVV
jgi:hypothetical protein